MKTGRHVIQALLLLSLWLGGMLAVQAQTRTVHSYYTDPQGTVLAKTDAQGTILARYDYTPYGSSVASLGSPPDGPGYTGHVNDPETGLVYMQARYYLPIGRFPSPDPVGPVPGNVYSFNRYDYANNNPIANTDPTGRAPGDLNDSACNQVFNCKVTNFGNEVHSSDKNIIPIVSYDESAPTEQEVAEEDKTPSRLTVIGSYRDPDCRECYDVYEYQLTNRVGVALTGDGYGMQEHIVTLSSNFPSDSQPLTSENRFVGMANGIGYDRVGLTGIAYSQLTPKDSYRGSFRQSFTVKYLGINYQLSTILAHDVVVERMGVNTTTVVIKK